MADYVKYFKNEDLKENPILKANLSKRNIIKDAHKIAFKEIQKRLEINNSMHILDVGCASGFFVSKLIKKNILVDYCDVDDYISHPLVKKLNKFKEVNLNIGNLPYQKEMFDTITCFDVYEHLENPYHVTREFFRVLKDKGLIFLKIPYAMNIWERFYFFLKEILRDGEWMTITSLFSLITLLKRCLLTMVLKLKKFIILMELYLS